MALPLPVQTAAVPADLLQERLLIQNFLFIGAVVFRREAALAVGGMDEQLSYTADWDFWLKLAGRGDAIYCPDPLACFRIHDATQTTAMSRHCHEFKRQMEAVLDRHLPPWIERHPAGQGVARAARFSVDVNTALAAAAHGAHFPMFSLAWQAMALGPRGWHRYLRDCALVERTVSRLRSRRRHRNK